MAPVLPPVVMQLTGLRRQGRKDTEAALAKEACEARKMGAGGVEAGPERGRRLG